MPMQRDARIWDVELPLSLSVLAPVTTRRRAPPICRTLVRSFKASVRCVILGPYLRGLRRGGEVPRL